MPFYERGPVRIHGEEAELSSPPGTSTRLWRTRFLKAYELVWA